MVEYFGSILSIFIVGWYLGDKINMEIVCAKFLDNLFIAQYL